MKPVVPKPQRCAIYTRKSTEHNLDLEFNSLDAKTEACEAYVKSQALAPRSGPLRRWRALGCLPRPPCPAKPPDRCQGRQDQHRGGLQRRSPHPLARRLRQAMCVFLSLLDLGGNTIEIHPNYI